MIRHVELGALLMCGLLLSPVSCERDRTYGKQTTHSETEEPPFRVGVPQKPIIEPAPEARPSPSGKQPDMREPAPGIRLSEMRINGARLAIAAIDSARFQPKVVGVTPEESAGRSPLGGLLKTNADLLLGSGFVEQFFPLTPLGLLVVDGVEISQLSPSGLSAILAIHEKRIALIRRDAYRPLGTLGAIQIGPWLIEDGVVRINPKEPERRPPFTRAFFALCEQGVWLAGVTLDPVHLLHLATFLASPEANGGYACLQAANLSGGGAEALVVRARKTRDPYLYGNVNLRQASLVAFVPMGPD